MRTVRTLFYLLAICISILTIPAYANTNSAVTAITVPSADVTLSFVKPGIIAKVLIKEGDKVKADQVLIQQNTETAQARLSQKKVELKRIEWAAERGSATELEVEHARLEVKILQTYVEDMRLKSPIAGTIDKIKVEVGEGVKGLDDVVRVVKTDPLWIDVPVPLAREEMLKLGQIAKIKFPDNSWADGKITYISTVADAASSTLRVRVEVPNKSNRPAGEHIGVIFPKNIIERKDNEK